MNSVMLKDKEAKLSIDELAEALYEGTPHLSNLAEKLARQHGKAGALSFYGMMGEDVQNFWKGIAKQLIDHAAQWQENNGSCCVLSEKEIKRLNDLPRVEEEPALSEAEHQQLLRETNTWLRNQPAPAPVGRNEPCPCGSGTKFKKCCGRFV